MTLPLGEDEREELQRLRAEASRRAHTWRPGWRTPAAAVLIVIGCLLAPLSVLAIWTGNQVSDTSRYVANVAPLITEQPIQHALADQITSQITGRLNVQSLVKNVGADLSAHGMPRVASLLSTFSGQISGSVAGFIHGQVARLMATQVAASLWVRVNRTAHAAIVRVLSGQGGGPIGTSNGQVVIDLGPFIEDVKNALSAQGFTLLDRLPAIHPTFVLFEARNLSRAQAAYRMISTLKFGLPIACLLFLFLGVYVARSRRRALLGAALGFAAAMFVLAAGLQIGRDIYLTSVPPSVLPGDAAAALFDTLVRFIKDGLRLLLVLGLLVATGAFLAGPSAGAARVRGLGAAAVAWLRAAGAVSSLRAGPAGRWISAHRNAVRVSTGAIAGFVFVFWPSAVTAVVLALLVLLVFGLTGRAAAPRSYPRRP